MVLTSFPLALSAAEAAAESTMLVVWLVVGALGLLIGLALVASANRRFKLSAEAVRALPIVSAQAEPVAAAA